LFAAREEPHVDSASRVVVFFGRLEAYKGLDVLAAAARDVEVVAPDIQFRVLGKGGELENFLALTRSLKNIHVVGRYISPAEAIHELRAAAVVVAPYKDATQSGVLAAAFANARPVIASRVGGFPELIIDGVNGRLVPPNDSAALAEAILHTMSDRTTVEAMSLAAWRTAEFSLAWDAIAAEIYIHYRSLQL
jgi:glycosyltransferase involved in cell wall biosynthesis